MAIYRLVTGQRLAIFPCVRILKLHVLRLCQQTMIEVQLVQLY